jgi:hypothetical protein
VADGALDLDDAVVEVDQHHAVGHDALAPDRDVLEARDRALLAHHGLGPDPDLALVGADLRAVADPRPAAQVHARVLADLEGHVGAHEGDPVGRQPPAEAQLQPGQADEQSRVADGQHAVLAHEAQQGQRPAVERRGLATDVGREGRRRDRGQQRLHVTGRIVMP